MRMGRRSTGIGAGATPLLLGVGLIVAGASDARAYIDPGTGSYVLQTVIAGLLGAAFAVKTFWGTIKSWFSRSPREGKRPPDAP